MKKILCFGDSNTWGFVPGSGQRYPENIRWPAVLAEILGPEYVIIEDGISGRTTVWDDPFAPCRNGLEGLGFGLLRAKPIDLVVIMLGTNDLYHTNAFGFYRGLSRVVRRILGAQEYYHDSSPVFEKEPKVLLVSPITLHPDIGKLRPELNLHYEESCQFAMYTKRLAEELSVQWIDAAAWAKASEVDGLHLTPEGHLTLGRILADTIKTML